ncbi:hypothetical protein pb186bvf_000150 [Paramecium bursaria]
MISLKAFKKIDQVPQIYKCLICNQIPKRAKQDSECGRLTCTSCLQFERFSFCDCLITRCKITPIDHITHKTLLQIQIECHFCLLNINYYQFNKHVKGCEINQGLKTETQKISNIYDKISEKLICKICKSQCNSVCKYCQIQSCNICSKQLIKCCQLIKFNQSIEISEDDSCRILNAQYKCNLCCEKINNFYNHSQQCQLLVINCEFCLKDYQRILYLQHLEQCLSEKFVNLKNKKAIQTLVIDLQNIYSYQAFVIFLKNDFCELNYDRIAREEETD